MSIPEPLTGTHKLEFIPSLHSDTLNLTVQDFTLEDRLWNYIKVLNLYDESIHNNQTRGKI